MDAVYDRVSGRMYVSAGCVDGPYPIDLRDTWSLDWEEPVAADASLVGFDANPHRVRLDWFVSRATDVTARVERRREGAGWGTLGQPTRTALDRLSYEDREVVPGARYGYRLNLSEAGGSTLTDEVVVQVPDEYRLDLVGSQPNPWPGNRVSVSFILSRRSPARLDLLDVAGRQISSLDLSSFEPGPHRVALEPQTRLEPGMYVIRLASAGQVRTRKALVIR